MQLCSVGDSYGSRAFPALQSSLLTSDLRHLEVGVAFPTSQACWEGQENNF